MTLAKFLISGAPLAKLDDAHINATAHGDSYFAGFYATAPILTNGFVGLIATATGLTIRNAGVGGISIDGVDPSTTMLGTAPTTVDPYFVAGKLNVLFCGDEINNSFDLGSGGRSAAQSLVSIRAYYVARHAAATAAGGKLNLVWFNSPPCGALSRGGSKVDFNNQMLGINAGLLSGPGGGVSPVGYYYDTLINVAAAAEFQGITAPYDDAQFTANGRYYTDFVHPNDAGHAVYKREALAKTNQWRRAGRPS